MAADPRHLFLRRRPRPRGLSAARPPGTSEDLLHRPQLLTCPSWSRKSSSVKVFASSFFWSHRLGLLLATTSCAFSMSDRTSPIPRMRDAIRSGWNGSRASSFSPVPRNLIGLPGHRPDREHRPAAGIAFDLGQDHAGEPDFAVELLGHVHRILPGHRIGDQEDLVWDRAGPDRRQFAHQFVVDVQAPARIQHDHVEPLHPGTLDAGRADRRRHRRAASRPMHRDIQRRPEADQLFDRRRTPRVGRHQQDPLASAP